MNEIVIEHVKVEDLPAAWRARLAAPADMHVTARMAETGAATAPGDFVTDDPAFGIWRDRADMAGVQAYVEKHRAPPYTRNEP